MDCLSYINSIFQDETLRFKVYAIVSIVAKIFTNLKSKFSNFRIHSRQQLENRVGVALENDVVTIPL